MGKRKTHEEFVRDVKNKYGDEYTIINKYIGSKYKINVQHNQCKYQWETTPNSLLAGHGCPICAGNNKKTHEEFSKVFYEKYGNEYTLLDEYVNSTTKLRVRHNCDYCGGEIRNMQAGQVLNDIQCLVCYSKKDNDKTFKEKLQKVNKNIIIIGEYVDKKTKIQVRHSVCGYEWKTTPDKLLRGSGCPKCVGKNLTLDDVKNRINKVNPNIEILSNDYGGIKVPLKCKCKKCKMIFEALPNNLYKKRVCVGCKKQKGIKLFYDKFQKQFGSEYTLLNEYKGNSRCIMKIRHNSEKCGNHITTMRADCIFTQLNCSVCKGARSNQINFEKKLFDKRGNEYALISEYISSNIKVWVRHNSPKCKFHKYQVTPNALISNNHATGCPVCAHKQVVSGVNDVATTRPDLAKYLYNEEDKFLYSYSNSKKRKMKCIHCGYIKNMSLNQLDSHGFNCPRCSDNVSYPEKFMMGVLEELNIAYETQYSPQWISPRKYDFYMKDLNMIIETHGYQHYKNNAFKSLGGRSLEQEQANDKLKRETALANGIKHYIELDCRESSMNFIKKSIKSSELLYLININNVNWKKCNSFATSYSIKPICDYWKNKKKDETTTDLTNIFKLDRGTIAKYLKYGTELGWCTYNPKEEREKAIKRVGGWNKKRVVILNNNNKVINICPSAAQSSVYMTRYINEEFKRTGVEKVCRRERKQYKNFKFFYLDNMTEEEKIKYNIPQKLKELEKNQAS